GLDDAVDPDALGALQSLNALRAHRAYRTVGSVLAVDPGRPACAGLAAATRLAAPPLDTNDWGAGRGAEIPIGVAATVIDAEARPRDSSRLARRSGERCTRADDQRQCEDRDDLSPQFILPRFG